MKTLFDAAGAVSSGLLRSGVLIGPALVANAVLGPTQMLYMNHEGFRARADQAIDWVLDKLPWQSGRGVQAEPGHSKTTVPSLDSLHRSRNPFDEGLRPDFPGAQAETHLTRFPAARLC
jgi:hypothetical protein